MAFEWKWQPTPLNLKPVDDRSKAASVSMQGYVPNEANIAVVGSPQAIAQSNMEGYVPYMANYATTNVQGAPVAGVGGNVIGGEGGVYRAPYGNYGQGMAYWEKIKEQDDLRAELAKNEQRIAQIKLEIAQLKGESGREWDALDMQLAANRANAGDIGNAIAHQNRIITRQQIAAANGGKTAADKEAEALVEEFIKTQSMMMMGDNSQRPGYQNMLNFLGDKIQKNPKAKKMLEQFQGKYGANANSNKTYQDFENFVSGLRTANANNKIKKNGLTQADKKKVDEYWYSLPQEVRDAHEKEYNDIRGEEDIETIQLRGQKAVAKQKAALKKFKDTYSYDDLLYKKAQGKLPTNIDGYNVSVTEEGDKFVVTIGKQKVVIDGNK